MKKKPWRWFYIVGGLLLVIAECCAQNDALLSQEVDAALRKMDTVQSKKDRNKVDKHNPAYHVQAQEVTSHAIEFKEKGSKVKRAKIAAREREVRTLKKQLSGDAPQDVAERETIRKLIDVNTGLLAIHEQELQHYLDSGYKEDDPRLAPLYEQIEHITHELDNLEQRLRALVCGRRRSEEPEKEEPEKKAIRLKPYGYVKSDNFVDTRQIIGNRDDQVSVFPQPRIPDANEDDINGRAQFNMLAIQTRFGVDVEGPDVLDAFTHAKIEADFWGPWVINNFEEVQVLSTSVINGFYLRHAFVQFDWDCTSLMIGQYWHPFYDPRAAGSSDLVSYQGVPFEPYSRNPQIRVTQYAGPIEFLVAAISQVDFKSRGPFGLSTSYLRNAVIPNFHFQIRGVWDKNVVGAGFDFKSLLPRRFTVKGGGRDTLEMITTRTARLKTTERISAFSGILYTRLEHDPVVVKAKVTFASNLPDQGMIGGYGVATRDPETGAETYTSLRNITFMFDIKLNRKVEPGLFIGYTKNIGSSRELFQRPDRIGNSRFVLHALSPNLDTAIAISPRVRWHVKPVMFAAELEYIRASFGEINQCGKVDCALPVDNVRFTFAAYYYF